MITSLHALHLRNLPTTGYSGQVVVKDVCPTCKVPLTVWHQKLLCAGDARHWTARCNNMECKETREGYGGTAESAVWEFLHSV